MSRFFAVATLIASSGVEAGKIVPSVSAVDAIDETVATLGEENQADIAKRGYH